MIALPRPAQASTPDDIGSRMRFLQKLQVVSNKIHATNDVEEIIFDLAQDICDLFDCERITLYLLSADKTAIVSRVKTGLKSSSDLRLQLSEQSIAGYVGLSKRVVNIADVYVESELRRYSPSMEFLREVDRRSGYRTREMLVAPMLDRGSGELIGVVQLMNSRAAVPFDRLAEEGIKELCATLAIAFAQRQKGPAVRTRYDDLIAQAVLTREEFERASRIARETGGELEDLLLDDYQVKPGQVGAALGQYFGVPYQPFEPRSVRPPDLPKNLKRGFFEASRWLPIGRNDDALVVVATDPEQVRSARAVGNLFPKTRIAYHVTTQREFAQWVESFFAGADATGEPDEGLDDAEAAQEDAAQKPGSEVSAVGDNELVKLVNKIIVDAYRLGATDIHIEPRPGKDKTVIRLRRDGTLEPYLEVPASERNALVARIKIMCDLDISERRKPQDGRIQFRKFGPLDIELRVATLPSAGQVEDVVLRILRPDRPMALDQLDLLPDNLARLKDMSGKPYGLFLVCGPTGSGKTTTLHSILGHLNAPQTKIWTVEDPVEITQPGLRQVQVNRKTGLDFSTVMRAFLRADPDVIMVGEMRDRETVSIGLEASLTGHLVFATLHTNSAPESIVRLLQMGLDPFNLADALLGVLAQRLAKRLCTTCKAPYHPDEDEVRALLREYCAELQHTRAFLQDRESAEGAVLDGWRQRHADGQGRFTLYRPVGCAACSQGYKGRIGLHELMAGTDDVKERIQDQTRVSELLVSALEDGMRTLKMDGIEKVLSGATDLRQVRAVCIK